LESEDEDDLKPELAKKSIEKFQAKLQASGKDGDFSSGVTSEGFGTAGFGDGASTFGFVDSGFLARRNRSKNSKPNCKPVVKIHTQIGKQALLSLMLRYVLEFFDRFLREFRLEVIFIFAFQWILLFFY
jgi:hypothetical protein